MGELIEGVPFGKPRRTPELHEKSADAGPRELPSLEIYLDALRSLTPFLRSLVWVRDEKDIAQREADLAQKNDEELIAILLAGNRTMWQAHPSFYTALNNVLTQDLKRSVHIIKKLGGPQ